MPRISTKRPLTVKEIERLQPAAKRYDRTVGLPSSLKVVVQPSGHKSWALKHAKVGKLTLATGTLEEARAWANDMLAEIRKGRDPRDQKKEEKEAAANTVAAVAKKWIDDNKPFLRPITTEDREGLLGRHILPALGRRPMGDITRNEVNGFIRDLAKKDKSIRDRRKPGGPKRVRKRKAKPAKPKGKLGITTITNVAATLIIAPPSMSALR
jgi:hypothetical protein